ncbi:MAG: hypothetical protein NW202_13550 [Nitrospira sp.]|nr:hypothetical protein [Nitrospira sp.]
MSATVKVTECFEADCRYCNPAPREIDGIPRRIRVDHFSAGENAIRAAVQVVEGMGASKALTDAVSLLTQAQSRVADHVEGIIAETKVERMR